MNAQKNVRPSFVRTLPNCRCCCAVGTLSGEVERRCGQRRGQALIILLRVVDLAGVERIAQLVGQRRAHGLLWRALIEHDLEIRVGDAQHIQRRAQPLHVLVGCVVRGHDEQARVVRGAALDDAGHVELLKLCLDAQGDAVGVLARGADGHGIGLVAVRRGHLRDLEDVRAAERIGGLGLVLLALLLGHGVDVGGLGVGIGRQQLGDGLAPDVLNAEQLDGARAVGCDMVVQIVKVTHIFPFPGHGLPPCFSLPLL